MAATVRARLGALARAHDLVRPSLNASGQAETANTTLRDLVETVMSPYLDQRDPSNGQIAFGGCDVPLGATAATSMALVLHEFATNAAKYGALSSVEGCVHIVWSIAQGNLEVEWREQGGPSVARAPERKGFGSQLSHHSIEGQLRGRIAQDWRPEGLVVNLEIPLDHLSS